MSQYINERELRVIGLSRSGNHAIIRWMLAQAPGRYCFLNCVEGGTNPYLTARPVQTGEVCWTNMPGFDLEGERRGRFTPKDWLVHSQEDAFLGYACHPTFERGHDSFVGPSRQRLNVLILRDPYNLFASRRRAGLWGCTPRTALRIWMQHAAAFLGQRPRLLAEPCVRISYNAWFASRAYRARTAAALGLPFTDAEARRVPDCLGGSSFDGTKYDGRAERMRVLERWRHYAADPEFRAMFTPAVQARAEALFGRLPAAVHFARSAPQLRLGTATTAAAAG